MLWLVLTLLACNTRTAPRSEVVLPVEVTESSALVRSRARPDVFWTLNDSGNAAMIFGVDRSGALVQSVRIKGVRNVDWEDLAIDGEHLWIADSGNNLNNREDLAIHRIAEPKAGQSEATVERTVRFTYPEQKRRPDPGEMNFDAEALFVDGGTVFLLTKHRSDQRTVLYRFPALEGEVKLDKLGSFDLGGDPDRYGGQATAADLSPDGTLAVLSYHGIFLFPRPTEGHNWLGSTPKVIGLDQDIAAQCEGIAWVGDTLMFTNEDRAIFTVDKLDTRERWP